MKEPLSNNEASVPSTARDSSDVTAIDLASSSVDATTRASHHVEIFDRPMCCSTGLCGPSIDPTLARFAADLEWLRSQGVQVDRYNLTQQPGDFTRQPDVVRQLQTRGVEALPIVRVDGRIVSQAAYPSREELAAWSDLAPVPSDPLTVLSQKCCSS